MKFWIGGATGFLGSHLVAVLKEAGHEMVLASLSGGEVHGLPGSKVNILSPGDVARSARGCDGAFFVAGKVSRDVADADLMHRIHVLGTRHALAELKAEKIPRVVYLSTSGTIAVGTDPKRAYDEQAPTPTELVARWPYYRTKLYAEREAKLLNEPGVFDVITVNPSLLLGPGDLRESSTADIRRFLASEIPATPAGGISFVDVRDVAKTLLLAFEKGEAGERYLLSAKNVTCVAFFELLERLSGVPAPRLKMPSHRGLAIGANKLFNKALRTFGGEPSVDEASVEMSQYFWYCDSGLAIKELGFSPRDPSVTLRDTIADMEDREVVFPRGAVVHDSAGRS